jgi:hypothetical protein
MVLHVSRQFNQRTGRNNRCDAILLQTLLRSHFAEPKCFRVSDRCCRKEKAVGTSARNKPEAPCNSRVRQNPPRFRVRKPCGFSDGLRAERMRRNQVSSEPE